MNEEPEKMLRCIDCGRPYPQARNWAKQSKRCFLCRIEWVKGKHKK